MRKIYITLGILLVAMMGMAYLYFSNLNRETSANDLSLNAATVNASIVFGFENDKSFYEILNGQNLFQNLLGESKSALLTNLKKNFADDNEIATALQNQKVYVSILPSAANKVDFLISAQLKDDSNASKLLKSLSKKLKVDKEKDLLKITFADSSQCFLGMKNSLILISNATSPLKNILTEKYTDLVFANYIKANSRTNKNAMANLYLNFSKVPQFLKSILNSNLTGELAIFNKQLAYAALSYNFSADKLLFNGYTFTNDPTSYYQLFAAVSEQKITINNILPEKTANYTFYGIKDYGLWYSSLQKWFTIKKENDKIEKDIAAINQKYTVDLKATFSTYFKNQLLTFQINTGEKFGAISLNNGEKLSQVLLDLSSEYAPDIRIFKEANIPYYFFGEPFKKFERPFYSIIDNYLVMANNAISLQTFLNSYSNNKLLINDSDYISFNDQLSATATICFYVNNKNSNNIFGRNLRPAYYKQYQDKSGFKNFDAFSYQLAGDNGKFLTNLLLFKKQEKLVVPDTLSTNP